MSKFKKMEQYSKEDFEKLEPFPKKKTEIDWSGFPKSTQDKVKKDEN